MKTFCYIPRVAGILLYSLGWSHFVTLFRVKTFCYIPCGEGILLVLGTVVILLIHVQVRIILSKFLVSDI